MRAHEFSSSKILLAVEENYSGFADSDITIFCNSANSYRDVSESEKDALAVGARSTAR